MQLTALGLMGLALGACSSSAEPQTAGSTQPPRQPPPRVGGLKAPPPAWIETRHGSHWLGYSSFCWKTTCADFVASRCGDKRHTPTLRLDRGELVRFQLGFAPTEVALIHGRRTRRLPLSRTPTWRFTR